VCLLASLKVKVCGAEARDFEWRHFDLQNKVLNICQNDYFCRMKMLTPQHWQDYELIDVGGGEKLERFGKYVTIRPEPQAVWRKALSNKEWLKRAHVKFDASSSTKGNWKNLKDMPEQWVIEYKSPAQVLKFRLGLTAFKHVGIFPEQASNWDYIHQAITDMKVETPKILNLFAYTGGASIAAKHAGADVVHCDSIKQVVSWARENMEISNLEGIRWTVEDAFKFVKREVRRGKKYHGIILDPPAYGHGPKGEKWKLEEQIDDMLREVALLLDEEEHFLILNTYSLGFSSIIVENLIESVTDAPNLETGELYLDATAGRKLPLGVFGRFRNF
jgi:23S rRNA (cytosine1962-C5)-methyltransferase